MTRVSIVFASLSLSFSILSAEPESDLFGVNFLSGSFASLDRTDGTPTIITSIGSGTKGLAWDSRTQTMYLLKEEITFPPNLRRTTLFTIDTVTGSVATVGDTGARITGLTFDRTFSRLYSVVFASRDASFWSIDPLTGVADFIGFTSISQPIDLATDPSGTIYAASFGGAIYTIDEATGAATFITRITIDGQSTGVTAIAFDENGDLYAVNLVENFLIIVDLPSGQAGIIGPTNLFDIRGLAFALPPSDTDGDGIPDQDDECPDSILDPTVVIGECDSGVANMLSDNGCTISDLIADIAASTNNHGRFVSEVMIFLNELQAGGFISGQERGAITGCVGQ